jgi:hypothetical protein
LKDESAKCIAVELFTVFSLLGFPKILQSDNGSSFSGAIISELLALMNVDKRHIAAYNPRANGSAERYVDIAKKTLLKMMGNNLQNWHLHLPMATLAINSRITSRHNTSAFELFFARPNPPLMDYSSAESRLMNEDELRQRNLLMLNVIYPEIDRLVVAESKKNDKVVNASKNRVNKSLTAGTVIYIIDQNKSKKHEPKFVGPYTIVERHGNSYQVKDSTGVLMDRYVPLDQMKIVPNVHGLSSESGNGAQSQEVSQILAHRYMDDGKVEFLVRWKGQPETEDSWEPEQSFEDPQTIQRYWSLTNQSQSTSLVASGRYNDSKRAQRMRQRQAKEAAEIAKHASLSYSQ